MSTLQPIPAPITATKSMEKTCAHPRVRVVARDEDADFVECLDCSEVFEASEFKDMAIEEHLDEELDAAAF